MSTKPPVIKLRNGYSAFVTALSFNTGWTQSAQFKVIDPNGTPITTLTLSGSGNRVAMTTTDGSTEYLAFGPYKSETTITVTLSRVDASGTPTTSNMLPPIEAVTDPGTSTAMIRSTSVISQSEQDPTKESCIATVYQYKAISKAAAADELAAEIAAFL